MHRHCSVSGRLRLSFPFAIMTTPKDKSVVVSPLWVILPVILLIGVVLGLSWLVVLGLARGETFTLAGRHSNNSYLVSRHLHPARYWLVIGIHALLALVSSGFCYSLIKNARNQMRK